MRNKKDERRFTYGETPRKLIEESLPDIYNMELVGKDKKLVADLVNQGIDSHAFGGHPVEWNKDAPMIPEIIVLAGKDYRTAFEGDFDRDALLENHDSLQDRAHHCGRCLTVQ